MGSFSEKNKYAIYMLPESIQKIDELYPEEGFESRSEFVERAVQFYCGYLTTDKSKEYLSDVLISTIGAKLSVMEDRLSKLTFKMAVELAMLMHVTAGVHHVDEDVLTGLRGMCVEEVKRSQGKISLDEVVRFQNE